MQVANAPHLPVHLGAMSEAVKFQVSCSLLIPPMEKSRSYSLDQGGLSKECQMSADLLT